jgi:hypothetical protein
VTVARTWASAAAPAASAPNRLAAGTTDGDRHAPTQAPPTALKFALLGALLALTVFDRFGLRISASYAISPGLVGAYALVGALLWTRMAYVNVWGALLYVAIVTIASISLVVNLMFDLREAASIPSWLLLCVLYAPFAMCLKPTPESTAMWHWLMRWWINVFAVCAVFGILQYFAQFVYRAPWVIDFRENIPELVRGSGTYNTSNAVGSAFKSNGFFLREASGFSFYMAFALICEWSLQRRKWLLALLGLGLAVSYSGSGLLVLMVAVLVPFGWNTFTRVAGLALVGMLAYFLLGDALNLNYTVGRVHEFGSDRSSAYCRFIAPAKLVVDQIDSNTWVTLVGHGPGTTQKLSGTCETTFGKMVFEYGLLGAMAFTALMIHVLRKPWMPLRMRVALAVYWYVLGGHLLGPDALLAIFMLCALWPRMPPGEHFGTGWGPRHRYRVAAPPVLRTTAGEARA